MRESLNLIHELDSLITAKHSTFDAECGKIEKACTVEQKVKFLLWIKSNADTLQQVKKCISFLCVYNLWTIYRIL